MLSNYYLLVIELLLSGILLGLLWFVQLVHYPLFFKIKEDFERYEKEHVKRVTYLVLPLIILDVFFNVIVTMNMIYHPLSVWIALSLGFNLMTWLATFFFQIDQHRQLCCAFSLKTLKSLIRTSWLRTLFWTIKTALITLVLLWF